MKRKIILPIFLIFYSFIFATPIVSAYGIPYNTLYEEVDSILENNGYTILDRETVIDTNTDRKIITLDSCDYDTLPYKQVLLCFDKYEDGKYHFSHSEGLVDTDKIDNEIEYSVNFAFWLQEAKEKYQIQTIPEDDKLLIGFSGENKGLILYVTSDTELTIMYFPKYLN